MQDSKVQFRDPGKLRVLEVGNHALFQLAVPEQTDFFYVGHRTKNRSGTLGPIEFVKVYRRLLRREYDLVVLHSARFAPWHPRTFLPILRDRGIFAIPWLFAPYAWRVLHLFHDVPVVGMDLSDTFGIGRHNFHLLDTCRFFFKRELPADRWQVFFKSGHWDLPGSRWRKKRRNQRRIEKLRPISLGAGGLQNMEWGTGLKKATDVFYSGDLFRGTTSRADGFPELQALASAGYKIDIPANGLPRNEYLERMAGAWLAWSPSGYGWDCYRHYEAAAVGTVALSNYPTIYRDKPFREGEHCLFYSPEPGELTLAIKSALADRHRLRRMGKAAREHFFQNHTERARAERIAVMAVNRRLDGSLV